MNLTRTGSAAALSFALPAVMAVLLSGCATNGNNSSNSRSSQIRCDEAVSQGVGFGQGEARAVAVSGLRNQVGDVRGYLVSQGVRRVRPTGKSVSCHNHPFGGGLVQCTAVTRFCGR
jgi:ABC-type Fe3+-hydroxamate transport system substrate-binding protein